MVNKLTMSLRNNLLTKLEKTLETNVKDVLEKIQKKYNIQESLFNIYWLGEESKQKSSRNSSQNNSLTDIDTSDLSPERLTKCKVNELKALCRKHGHKVSGKKDELVARLLGKESLISVSQPTKTKKVESKIESVDVIKKLTSKIPPLVVRRNAHGNYEHPESGLVFNNTNNNVVIGRQMDDGRIAQLSKEDIELCKKYGCKYELPSNLDTKTSLDEVEVEDLESGSESEVELEEDDEEELDEEEFEIEDESD